MRSETWQRKWKLNLLTSIEFYGSVNIIVNKCWYVFNPIQTGGGGGALEALPKLNNFKAVKAMTTKCSDFS